MTSIFQITLFTLIPAAAALIGGSIGSLRIPRKNFVSALQHFVAGVLIAAVATELLPKILGEKNHLTIAIGFVIGVIAMLLIEAWAHRLMQKKGAGLITGACIDLFVDGLLIGVSFLAGLRSGLVIALSLSFCAFFLSMTVMTTLKGRGISRLLPLLLIAAMLPLGGFIGGAVVSKLPHIILLETISFGVAALLYLGIEELLGEAHKREDNVWISATFFLGFFVVFIFQ